MKLKNEDKVLIGGGVLALGAVGFLYWKKKQKEKEEEQLLINDIPEPSTVLVTPVIGNPIPTQGAVLDKNKVLAKGSKGLEVRELQRLLGVTIDGDFGNKTLSALQSKKGVSKISINGYLSTKNIVYAAKKATATALVIPKVGQKVMANISKVSVFNAKKTASGAYFNDGTKPFLGGTFEYGEHIGTFVASKVGGQYLINRNGVYYFVNGSVVKAY